MPAIGEPAIAGMARSYKRIRRWFRPAIQKENSTQTNRWICSYGIPSQKASSVPPFLCACETMDDDAIWLDVIL